MSASAPTEGRTLTDAPPAKSWAVYTYDTSPPTPGVPCHIYGYNADGSPMGEEEARNLAAQLPDSTVYAMVLPNEDAPAPA